MDEKILMYNLKNLKLLEKNRDNNWRYQHKQPLSEQDSNGSGNNSIIGI
jgi:hypothetical protein